MANFVTTNDSQGHTVMFVMFIAVIHMITCDLSLKESEIKKM